MHAKHNHRQDCAELTQEDAMEAPTNRNARLNTVEEVMDRLRIGRSTTFELIASRRLRSVKVGRRRLVSEAALTEFIEQLDRGNTD